MIQIKLPLTDKAIERRRALAKICILLINLAKNKEVVPAKANRQKERSEPLKNNIPLGQ